MSSQISYKANRSRIKKKLSFFEVVISLKN